MLRFINHVCCSDADPQYQNRTNAYILCFTSSHTYTLQKYNKLIRNEKMISYHIWSIKKSITLQEPTYFHIIAQWIILLHSKAILCS